MFNLVPITRLGLALALAVVLVASFACGGDSDTGGTAAIMTNPSAPQQPDAPAAAAQPSASHGDAMPAPTAAPAMAPKAAPETMAMVEPKVERVIVGIVPFSDESNVRRVIGQVAAVQFDPMDESLIGMDPMTGQKVPELAESWALEGGNTWRIKLREDVQFHKGWGEFTGRDVVYSYQEYIKEDAVGGVRAPLRRGVDRIEVVNDHEVLIHLKQFDADLTNLLSRAQPAVNMVSSAHAAELGRDPEFREEPIVGTGPYQFKSREQAVNLVYERFENHWSQRPDFPELELKYMNEASTRLAALLTDEIHMTNLPDDLTNQAVAEGMEVIQGRASARRVAMRFLCCYVHPETREWPMHPDSPLQDIRVRQALNKAINRAELNDALLQGKGRTMYVHSIDETWAGFNPRWVTDYPQAYGYDPIAARALLADAGYNENNPLETNVSIFPVTALAGAIDVQEVIASYITDLGVKVNLVQDDAATRRAKGRNQGYTNHVSMITTSAGQIVGSSVYMSNTSFSRGATTPEADAKFLQIRAEQDTNRRAELWREYGDIVYDNFINLNLYWLPAEVVANPAVVSDFVWPGALSGFWSHFWLLKSA